ncbi:hypothetical protein [Gordonibacter sp. Marseille-P4307]|uniref:hypothetical protein n=1 Tax=Gordonibacter sp. Marseille-P4307 TaxID=2161815 RepID=UPI000F52A3F5|nr:hypothetical protein [Gordonibacter sp. Marseille-P4307]
MSKLRLPLHYAIIKHFEDGRPDCAEGVIRSLESDYAGYKLLALKDVEETLATAKENGVLEEADFQLDGAGRLRILYRISDFGKDMVRRYIG